MKQILIMIVFLAGMSLPLFSFASSGTIISPYKYAWSSNGGYINFENVTVGDSALMGHAWSENHGWIKFNPAQGGVLNDGTGNLSGYAWGEQLGWVDFDNVSINADGRFTGTANGSLVGTLTFDCNYCDVRTDWRQAGSSSSSSVPQGGGIFGQNILSPAQLSAMLLQVSSGSSSSNQSGSSFSQYNIETHMPSHELFPWSKPPRLPSAPPSLAALSGSVSLKSGDDAENSQLSANNNEGSGHNQTGGPSEISSVSPGSFAAGKNIDGDHKYVGGGRTNLFDNFPKISLGSILSENIKQAYESVPQKAVFSAGAAVIAPVTMGMQYLMVQGSFMPAIKNFSDLWLMIAGAFQGFLSLVGIRKKRRYWGIVYDSKTKQPIDPALVELIDATTGKVVKQSITDISGRFGFLDSAGVYRIRARKTHYVFPSALITGSTDSIYKNIYRGELITVSEQSDLITPNIPMDPIAFDWNQEAKQKIVKFHPKLEIATNWALAFIFWLGLVFVSLNFIFEPGALSGAFLTFYVLLAIVRKFIPRAKLFGRVVSATINVAGLIVEISFKHLPQIIFNQTFTTRGGKFFIMAPKGEYVLRVKRAGESGAAILLESDIFVGGEGVVNDVINI